MLLVAIVVVVAALVAVGAVRLGATLLDRQRAQTAADAAALAGVQGGRSTAAQLAAGNGATLVSFTQAGDTVTVVVIVGDVRAQARATNGP